MLNRLYGRPLFAICSLLTFNAVDLVAQTDRPLFAWRENPATDPMTSIAIECDLALVGKKSVKLGEQFVIDYRIRVTGPATEIYNPFMDRRLPKSATLAVFDRDKSYQGDLLLSAAHVRSEVSAGPGDWVFARNRNSVGSELKVYSREPHLREPPPRGTPITKPGAYYLQLIFSERAVSSKGDAFPKEVWDAFYRKWQDRTFREDYCRSNVIELVVE